MKTCFKCKQTKIFSDFSKDRTKKDGFQAVCKLCRKDYWKNYYQRTKPDRDNYDKEYRESNPEKVREWNRKAVKKWEDNNKESRKEYKKQYELDNQEKLRDYRKIYYEDHKEERRNYKQSNQGRYNALNVKRRKDISQATPSYANLKEIDAFYEESKSREMSTGRSFHVDHIVPIHHDLVCGLHVEYNLQVISADKNLEKSNKFKPGSLYWTL